MAEKGWFWRKQGSVFGPVTEEILRVRILDGEVTRGMPVREDEGQWMPVEQVEDWDILLGSAENVRKRNQEAAVRRGFGMAGLAAVLCVSAWSLAGQLPSPQSQQGQHLLQTQTSAGVPASADEVHDQEGGLPRSRIHAGFEEATPNLQGCAERFQLNGGEVPDKMMLTYVIQNSGVVTDVFIHPARVANSPMGRCMVGVMRRLDYPTFVGKVRPVSFPVVFD